MGEIERRPPTELAQADRAPRPTIDQMVRFWLDSKGKGGSSPRTTDAYAETITSARAALHAAGLDLDSDPAAVSVILTRWAGHRLIDGQPDYAPVQSVAPSTYAHRLACVSSFYSFAQRRAWLTSNPADMIDRPTVQPYAESRALDAQAVRAALAALDTTTLQGKRDYALLSVAITTGRRRAELARLRWRDITVHDGGVSVTIRFATKGNKRIADTLGKRPAAALLQWLHTWHGAALGSLPPDAPVWVGLAPPPLPGYGQPLSANGITAIVRRVFGDGVHPHQLRHTFAAAMEQSGADLTDTQRRLGHSNAATTGRYLAGLAAAENPHADALADLLLPE